MTDHHLDVMARAVFAQAAAEGRSGELLEALWNGAGCNLDPFTRSLVILPADTLATAFPDAEAPDPQGRTPYAAVTEGIAGAGIPLELQPTGWSRVAVPFPPGSTVAVAAVTPSDGPPPATQPVTCQITGTPDEPRLEIQGRWQLAPHDGAYHLLVELDTAESLLSPPWCRTVTEDTGVHLWAADAAPGDPCLCGNRRLAAPLQPPAG